MFSPTTISLLVLFGISCIVVWFEYQLSTQDYPSYYSHVFSTILLGITAKWGVDLLMEQDMANFVFVLAIGLLLIGSMLSIAINRRHQYKKEQDKMISSIKLAVKEGFKEAVNEIKKPLIGAINKSVQDGFEKAIKKLERDSVIKIKRKKGGRNAKKERQSK